jgi:hypothetical protein
VHVAHFLIVFEACMSILFTNDVKIYLFIFNFSDHIGFSIVSPRMVQKF